MIYDANNGAKATRNAIAERFEKEGIHVVMLGASSFQVSFVPHAEWYGSVESLCDNKDIIEGNIRSVKISSPDYRGWNPDKAVEDYYHRIKDHEKHYETIDDQDWPFIKIMNVCRPSLPPGEESRR